MKLPTLIAKLFDELKKSSILDRVSFVANLFTIIGISIAVLLIKPSVEWILKKKINATNFFGFGGILLFWILVFFAILAVYTYLKPFFLKFRFGLFFYYGLIVVYFLLGFAMLSSIGFEFMTMMVSD